MFVTEINHQRVANPNIGTLLGNFTVDRDPALIRNFLGNGAPFNDS